MDSPIGVAEVDPIKTIKYRDNIAIILDESPSFLLIQPVGLWQFFWIPRSEEIKKRLHKDWSKYPATRYVPPEEFPPLVLSRDQTDAYKQSRERFLYAGCNYNAEPSRRKSIEGQASCPPTTITTVPGHLHFAEKPSPRAIVQHFNYYWSAKEKTALTRWYCPHPNGWFCDLYKYEAAGSVHPTLRTWSRTESHSDTDPNHAFDERLSRYIHCNGAITSGA